MAEDTNEQFDADYDFEIDENPRDWKYRFSVTRKPYGSDSTPEYFKLYTGSVSILVDDFTLEEGLNIDGGWSLSSEEFFKRDTPEEGLWYCEGSLVEYEDGKARLPSSSLHSRDPVHTRIESKRTSQLLAHGKLRNQLTLGVLGYGKHKSTSGTCYINLGAVNKPSRFYVNHDVNDSDCFSVEITLGPDEFEDVLKGVLRTGCLYIEIDEFVGNPILMIAERDSMFSPKDVYWVPYNKPFHELYAQFMKSLGDGYHRQPRVCLNSGAGRIGTQSENPDSRKEPTNEKPQANELLELLGHIRSEVEQNRSVLSKIVSISKWALLLLGLLVVVNTLI